MTRSSPSPSNKGKKREYIEISSDEEEDPASQLCVVLDGSVCIGQEEVENADVSDVSTERLVAGQVFGQVGLFCDASRNSGDGGLYASTADSARICKLPGSAYRSA